MDRHHFRHPRLGRGPVQAEIVCRHLCLDGFPPSAPSAATPRRGRDVNGGEIQSTSSQPELSTTRSGYAPTGLGPHFPAVENFTSARQKRRAGAAAAPALPIYSQAPRARLLRPAGAARFHELDATDRTRHRTPTFAPLWAVCRSGITSNDRRGPSCTSCLPPFVGVQDTRYWESVYLRRGSLSSRIPVQNTKRGRLARRAGRP